jgi:TonB family protein
VSKIYDELKRAQKTKRETISLDSLASVMENPSFSSTVTVAPVETQPTISQQPPSKDVESSQGSAATAKDFLAEVIPLPTTAPLPVEALADGVEHSSSRGVESQQESPAPVKESVADTTPLAATTTAFTENHLDGEEQYLSKGLGTLQESPSKVKNFIADLIQRTTTAELRPPKYSRWLVVAIALVVLLTAGLLGLRLKHQQSFIATSESSDIVTLGLRSERAGEDLRLSWNRNAPAVQQATGGHISISDGAVQKEFDLGLSELRNGSLMYSPISDNVLVQLQLKYNSSQQTISESVRIVAGSSSQLVSRQEKSVGPPISHAASREASPSAALKDSPPKVATVNRAEPTVTINERQEVARSSTSNRSDEEQSVTSTRTDTVTETTPAVAPLATASSTATDTARKTSESALESSASVPIIPSSTAKGLEPAELLQGKKPDYPFIARQSNIQGSVVVHFRISSTGEVQNVSVVRGSPLLVNAAVQAVKAWRYKPARLNGSPVDSEGDITFEFKPH